MKIAFIIVCLSQLCYAFSQTPETPFKGKILITNGTLHVGNGKVIDRALIAVEDGQITLVKSGLTYTIDRSLYDTVINVSGKHIYPGFINMNNVLGITEVEALRQTNDFDETGSYNPNIRAAVGFNTGSEIISTVRSNGVLLTQCTPRGGKISGTSSVMKLDAWNWEDAVVKMNDGIHVNWPVKISSTGWWANPGPNKTNNRYENQVIDLVKFIRSAKAYVDGKSHDEINLKFEAFRSVFEGDKRIYFHAEFANEINEIIDLSRELKFKFPVIVGGYDSWLLTERLKENNFSVVLNRLHHLPQFEEEDVNAPYKLPKKLEDSGILYCISMHGEMEAMNSRNLPFQAGTARTFGLENEEAVAAISLNAAKILGIDDILGTVEEGKIATLFISNGDALDMKSNQVIMAMVSGVFLNLENRQIKLYKTYSKKYDN